MPPVRVEVWTRPGDPAFGRRIATLPAITHSATVNPFNGFGEGRVTLPDNYPRIADIISPDTAAPLNAIKSLVRVYLDGDVSGVDPPLAEWIPNAAIPPQESESGRYEVSGLSIESIVNNARVAPWDWDGTAFWPSEFPDWIYGGRNILRNGDFEDSGVQNEVYEMYTTATGGTFTLTPITTPTAAIAFNAGAGTVESAIEAALLADGIAVPNVLVVGSGTETAPWQIEFVTPFMLSTPMTANGSGLTPANSHLLVTVQVGQLVPTGWTKSQRVDRGVSQPFGDYDQFRVTTAQNHTPGGQYSLEIDPAFIGRPYAGAQQLVKVKPGGLYQASIWVRTSSTTALFRLVIRGIQGEEFIASSTPFGGSTVPANTWTQFVITDLRIPDHISEIIFRFAIVNQSGDFPSFFIDDAVLAEGMPASTVGQIFTDLYLDATLDHIADAVPRNVWFDGTNHYLTLDFDGTNDSDGVAWDTVRSMTIKRGQPYGRVLSEFARLGYEWRVVPDTVDGTWLLQLFNPGGMGQDFSAANTPTIRGGRDLTRRALRRYMPPATVSNVEAAEQAFQWALDTDAIASMDWIETYQSNIDIDPVESLDAANQQLQASLRQQESIVANLAPQDGNPLPLVDYRVGDIIRVLDPPEVDDVAYRVQSITYAYEDLEGLTFSVSLGSQSFAGTGTIAEAVKFLMSQFDPVRQPLLGPSAIDFFGGGGGAPTITVAAADATEQSKAKADLVCTGVNDQDTIEAAVETIRNQLDSTGGQSGGRVLLTEGTFRLTGNIDLRNRFTLQGLNPDATVLFIMTNFGGATITTAPGVTIRDLSIQKLSTLSLGSTTPRGILVSGVDNLIENCRFVQIGGGASNLGTIHVGLGLVNVHIVNCEFDQTRSHAITLQDLEYGSVTRCRFRDLNTTGTCVRITNGSNFIVVAHNNFFLPEGHGVQILNSQDCIIADNLGYEVENDFVHLDTCSRIQVHHNQGFHQGARGVFLTGSNECEIDNNLIESPGYFQGTSDGILVDANSDRNFIHHNVVKAYGLAANVSNSAININNANCDDNIYVGNVADSSAGAFDTADYIDNGTGTQNTWPAAAAPQGDNFVR